MPLPSPQKDEKRSDFMGRCMTQLADKGEFKDTKQRAAVCYSQLVRRKKSKKS